MLADTSFWVAVALFLFLALLAYLGVPGMIARAFDNRTREISRELEDARQLRDDAQAMLADYQRKQKEAEQEAQEIIERANAEADRLRKEAEQAIHDQIKRRTELAEQKIAQAELRAIAEVRGAATDVAIGAARRVLSDSVDESADSAMIDKTVSDVERLFKSAH